MGSVALGMTAGISAMSEQVMGNVPATVFKNKEGFAGAEDIDRGLKQMGKKDHPVAYDISQAVHWGVTWSNVYYLTNEETGTPNGQLGVLAVLRHDGILFSLKDELIEKYELGKLLKGTDLRGNTLTRNPMYDPKDGDMPASFLTGLKGLMEKGAMVCVCNMALKWYSGIAASQSGLNADEVYNEFVDSMHPGIEMAPSGVWVLGRLAKNGIAYIDASLG